MRDPDESTGWLELTPELLDRLGIDPDDLDIEDDEEIEIDDGSVCIETEVGGRAVKTDGHVEIMQREPAVAGDTLASVFVDAAEGTAYRSGHDSAAAEVGAFLEDEA